ncbi:DUF2290 domain-containing protein [Comamonas koreensis]|uniref:DUF2290 domain-containing protein n=1 Tax=Comamonas koreensis TaxID=160825 RepID=A0AAW4XTK5_9BURK|nr:DUF2290 domain-containing protein [Comamonas koreensis]MCD2164551.1 DUF2290 domain-containing protein [Comamonas koreensis]
MHKHNIQAFARAAKWPIMEYGAPNFLLTKDIIQQLRELPYLERWKISIANQWYHILLEDHSFLTFSSTPNSDSFAFLQCPLEIPTQREFIKDLDLPFNSKTVDTLKEDYQMVMDTATQKSNITPIRYDYDEKGYNCGIHPVSHIHIGLDNDIRLSFSKRLTSTSFSLFVMRQMYPESWKRILEHQDSKRLQKAIRHNCTPLEEHHWKDDDKIELHFV